MSDCFLLDNVVEVLELEVVGVGEAKRRKKLDLNYGKPRPEKEKEKEQRRSPWEEAMEEADLGYEEEDEDEYERATGIYAEMKKKGMTLDEFKERFSEELEVIEVGQITMKWGGSKSDIEMRYRGPALIVKHQLEKGSEAFPFSDAEDPEVRVPSEVFDYLSSLDNY